MGTKPPLVLPRRGVVGAEEGELSVLDVSWVWVGVEGAVGC
jgi:hypothetical protein